MIRVTVELEPKLAEVLRRRVYGWHDAVRLADAVGEQLRAPKDAA